MNRFLLIHWNQALSGQQANLLRPGTITWLGRIARELPFELLWYGTSVQTSGQQTTQQELVGLLAGEGIQFTSGHPDDPARLATLLAKYKEKGFEMAASYVISGGETDLEWAHHAGCRTIRFADENDRYSSLTTQHWEDVYRFLKGRPRSVAFNRSSAYADVRITLDIDGRGKALVDSGLPWADRLLPLLAEKAGFDLDLRMKPVPDAAPLALVGDLSMAFGMAYSRAFGRRTTIEQYGFTVPYSDALAHVAVSLNGVPHLQWELNQKTNDFTYCKAFLTGFCQYASCTIHIRTQGKQEAGILSATFIALGRALAMAVKSTEPSA